MNHHKTSMIFAVFLLSTATFISCLQTPKASKFEFACKDENGRPIDWSIAYNLVHIDSGSEYLHINGQQIPSGKAKSSEWILAHVNVDAAESVVRKTLTTIYDSPTDVNYILYNDQPPPGGPAGMKTRAHSKGVLVFDTSNDVGFWMMHSLPRFPIYRDSYQGEMFDGNLGSNAQLFMCATFRPSQSLEPILKHLRMMKVQTYDSAIDNPNWSQEVDNLISEVLKPSRKPQPKFKQTELVSYGGQNFTIFSKSPKFQTDLYTEVGEILGDDLLVATWRQGAGGVLDSKCDHGKQIITIEGLSYNHDGETHPWPITKEHSKWAITRSEKKGAYFCIGDLNRADSQKIRGGGMVCLKDESVHLAFSNLIDELCDCTPKQKSECHTLKWKCSDGKCHA